MSEPGFKPLDKEKIARLAELIGEECIATSSDVIERCSFDETEDLSFPPALVVFPQEAEQVSRLMHFASQHLVPVTPRGGGTGLSGGALAVHGGIVVSFERMNRIIEIDTENSVAVVEPGVVTQVLQEEVEKRGLFYPPDPASRGSCSIGGNVAECAGGPRAVKYGVTKDYLLGLEAVLPDGTFIRHGGKLLKNVAGYNLTQLLTGSEGTLALLTKIYLKLIPLPTYRSTLLIPFPDLRSCARAVSAVMNAGLLPSALEFIEQAAISITERHLGIKLPHGDAAAQLLVELDGEDEQRVERDSEIVCEVTMGEGAGDVLLADSERKQRELWDMRRAIGEAVKSISVYKEEDTVVPRSNLVPLTIGVKEIAARYGITTVCYGHAGDGNLHVNILKMDADERTWKESLDPAIEEIFRLTVSLGGTISGEHGIGYSQRRYLPLALSAEEIDLLRRIKGVFDPKNILNPGKIFP